MHAGGPVLGGTQLPFIQHGYVIPKAVAERLGGQGLLRKLNSPPFGHCDTCGAPLWDLICGQCGEVYD